MWSDGRHSRSKFIKNVSTYIRSHKNLFDMQRYWNYFLTNEKKSTSVSSKELPLVIWTFAFNYWVFLKKTCYGIGYCCKINQISFGLKEKVMICIWSHKNPFSAKTCD